MKYNRTSLILIMVFILGKSYAQLNDFDLSDYKLPEIERRALETNFNLSGNNSFVNSADQYNYYGYNKAGTNTYHGNFKLNYNHFLNNADYQKEINSGINFSSNFYNRKNNKKLSNKNNDVTSLIYYKKENRRYESNNSFFETDVDLSYQYGENNIYSINSYDSSENKENIQTHSALIYAPLKIGKGRIEEVQDARHAVYLFEELSKTERINNEKSKEEIIEFAELISKLKNERFFDSRLKRISELESIDSFLIANDYLLKSDARYFATLADYWAYGNRPIRYSGTRFSGAILPAYYFYNYDNQGDGIYLDGGKYNFTALLLSGGIEFKHEKPLNLFWQNSIDLGGYLGIVEGNMHNKVNLFFPSDGSKIRIPNLQLIYSQSIGFYPNTRTDMSFTYSLQYAQFFDETNMEKKVSGVEGKGAKASTNLSINYYVSPKLRLNLYSSFYYIWQDSKDDMIIDFNNLSGNNSILSNLTSNTNEYFKEKEILHSLNVSLIYSIF